jgi:hypothetical protein
MLPEQQVDYLDQALQRTADAVSLLLRVQSEMQQKGVSAGDLQEASQLILSQRKILPVWMPYNDGTFRGEELKHIRSDGTFIEGPDDITLKLLSEKLPESNRTDEAEIYSTGQTVEITPSNQRALEEQRKIDEEEKTPVEYSVQGNLVLRRVLGEYNFQNEQDIDIFSLNGEFIRHCKRFFTKDQGNFKRILDDNYDVILLDSDGQERSPGLRKKPDDVSRYISKAEDDNCRRLFNNIYSCFEPENRFFTNDLWSKHATSLFDPRITGTPPYLKRVEMVILSYEGEAISEKYKYISIPREDGSREAVDFFNRSLILTKGEDGFFHEEIDNQVKE